MKNSSNLAFIILILVVLGCSCPKNNESEKQPESKTPSTEKTEDSSSKKDSTRVTTSSDSALSIEKFNRIEYGMEYLEVVNILGSDGKIIKVSPDGTVRYLRGDDAKFIMITFMNDKVGIKSQNGLD